MPDSLEALVTYLRNDDGVASLCEGRVWRPELPNADGMPQPTVVVRRSGGGVLVGAGSYLSVHDERIDINAYGSTPGEAAKVSSAVFAALKSLRRQVSDETLVHWAIPEMAPMSLRDPDTEWPYEVSSWQVLISEVEV